MALFRHLGFGLAQSKVLFAAELLKYVVNGKIDVIAVDDVKAVTSLFVRQFPFD